MSTKIARATQLGFASNAGSNQIEQFGSLATGVPNYTTNIATIQALSNYLTGWFGGVVGSNAPAIEDLNALCYLFSYQIGYILQTGVPEWDSGTPYFIGSIAQDGVGNVYVSLTNSNLNNALTVAANWRPLTTANNLVAVNPAGGTYASPYTMTSADNGKTFLVNSANGAMTFNLPTPSTSPVGFSFKVKDSGGLANTNGITYHRHAAENFESLAADYVFNANGGEQEISTDNTNWFIIGR